MITQLVIQYWDLKSDNIFQRAFLINLCILRRPVNHVTEIFFQNEMNIFERTQQSFIHLEFCGNFAQMLEPTDLWHLGVTYQI